MRELEQEIFGAAPGALHALTRDLRRKGLRNPPAEPRLVDFEGDDGAAEDVRLDAAARRLDLRQLRQTT